MPASCYLVALSGVGTMPVVLKGEECPVMLVAALQADPYRAAGRRALKLSRWAVRRRTASGVAGLPVPAIASPEPAALEGPTSGRSGTTAVGAPASRRFRWFVQIADRPGEARPSRGIRVAVRAGVAALTRTVGVQAVAAIGRD